MKAAAPRPEPRHPWRMKLVWVLLAILGLWLVIWLWPTPQGTTPKQHLTASVWGPAEKAAPAQSSAPNEIAGQSAAAAAGAAAVAVNSTGAQGAQGAPAGVSAEQWTAFLDSLAQHPQRDAEIARVRAFLNFQQELERYRALRKTQGDTPPSAELQALANSLDAGLDARLAQREMSAGEAAMLKSALAESMGHTRTSVPSLVAAWKQTVQAPAAPPDAREASFAREQAALLQAWQAQPASQRDAAALEQALEAARARHFPDNADKKK